MKRILDIPEEMGRSLPFDDLPPAVPGLSDDCGGWRLVGVVSPGGEFQDAHFYSCPARELRRRLGHWLERDAIHVSTALFASPACAWPPLGMQPGVLDLDWVETDWANRSPARAVELVESVTASWPFESIGDSFSLVCTGNKGIHVLYDLAAASDTPRKLRESIREAVPAVAQHDDGLYLDIPHWFRRVPGSLNYSDALGSCRSVELPSSSIKNGSLETALARQWHLAG
jgi:hypothetical protein